MADTTAAGSNEQAASADVSFIDEMVPHHEMGIHMADMVLQNGSREEVKDIARKIKDSQQQELDRMKALRQDFAGSNETPGMATGDDMPVPMESMMAMQGEELDRAFLQNMIPHHRQSMDMVQQHQQHLQNPELKDLAQKMLMEHQKELTRMEEMGARSSRS